MLRNMASSLLKSDKKRIITTHAKAKELRKYIEPLITKARTNTTHSRRTVFRYLNDKEAAKILFGEVAAKVGDRPGGYTRILKLGPRQGDNAEMALIELVDFSEFSVEKPKKSSRRRRKKSSTGGGNKKQETKAAAKTEEVKAKAEEAAEEAKSDASSEEE